MEELRFIEAAKVFMHERGQFRQGDVMIHAAHKGAENPKESFNLRGVGKFKLPVDVSGVLDRPHTLNAFVDASAVCPELGERRDMLVEKFGHMASVDCHGGDDPGCSTTDSALFGSDKGMAFLAPEKRFIHLDYSGKKPGVLERQVGAEPGIPAPDGGDTTPRKLARLQHRYLLQPAPEDEVPRFQRQFEPFEPAGRSHGEGIAALPAAPTGAATDYGICFTTPGAGDLFAKHDLLEQLVYLDFRGNVS